MSLRYAILGVLSSMPMTGYDMVRHFDESVGTFWPSSPAQIYQELRRMEADGLIAGSVARRGQRAEKRIYDLTEGGRQAFKLLTIQPNAYPTERDSFRLQFCYFDLIPNEVARDHLDAHITHNKLQIEQLRARIDGIRNKRSVLIQSRLSRRPPEVHEAILQFRIQALEAHVLRAQAEITWAKRAIKIFAQLAGGRPVK
jgi:PadR family transcriptional regulator, regulatory protein AphA